MNTPENRVGFNLTDEPWIRARLTNGTTTELSLRDVFRQARQVDSLAGDIPTQDLALLRLLLAVLQRVVVTNLADLDREPDPIDAWTDLWQAPDLPWTEVNTYLDRWQDQFDLLDPDRPFMQVAGLRTARDDIGDVKKIVADIPDGNPFFTTRWSEGTVALSFAEAARWLVHCQAFDISGIKTGVVGDKSVKGGKSYPIGTGWAGKLGGLYIEGDNLRETLLLNLMLRLPGHDYIDSLDADLPCWEYPPRTVDTPAHQPTGPADLYTWQSRRIRFTHDGSRVIGLVLTNGDRLDPQNRHGLEPLTGWRRSAAQEKKLGSTQVYMPAEHKADRAMWRGLQAVLPSTGTKTSDGAPFLPPAIASWLGGFADHGVISLNRTLQMRACGVVYGSNNSTIAEIVDDTLAIYAVLLSDAGNGLVGLANDCVTNTDQAVFALGLLAANLESAAGGDAESAAGPKERARERAYFAIDHAFRRWLADLGPDTDQDKAKDAWHLQARQLLEKVASELVSAAGPAAFVGHPVTIRGQQTWMTSGRAEQVFRAALRKALPLSDEPSSETKERSAS